MKLLLISNSTNAGEEYLRYPLPEIGRFLDGVREIVFVPYAAVTFSYADYEKKVQARFAELGIRVRSVHRAKDPAALVRGAEAICVGGGNTFALAKKMQQQGLMTAILRKINKRFVHYQTDGAETCPFAQGKKLGIWNEIAGWIIRIDYQQGIYLLVRIIRHDIRSPIGEIRIGRNIDNHLS